jgi:hypothetical protein
VTHEVVFRIATVSLRAAHGLISRQPIRLGDFLRQITGCQSFSTLFDWNNRISRAATATAGRIHAISDKIQHARGATLDPI